MDSNLKMTLEELQRKFPKYVFEEPCSFPGIVVYSRLTPGIFVEIYLEDDGDFSLGRCFIDRLDIKDDVVVTKAKNSEDLIAQFSEFVSKYERVYAKLPV